MCLVALRLVAPGPGRTGKLPDVWGEADPGAADAAGRKQRPSLFPPSLQLSLSSADGLLASPNTLISQTVAGSGCDVLDARFLSLLNHPLRGLGLVVIA
jgi:hypothetical protein